MFLDYRIMEVMLIGLVTTAGVFTCSMLLGTCLHETNQSTSSSTTSIDNIILQVSNTESYTCIECCLVLSLWYAYNVCTLLLIKKNFVYLLMNSFYSSTIVDHVVSCSYIGRPIVCERDSQLLLSWLQWLQGEQSVLQ